MVKILKCSIIFGVFLVPPKKVRTQLKNTSNIHKKNDVQIIMFQFSFFSGSKEVYLFISVYYFNKIHLTTPVILEGNYTHPLVRKTGQHSSSQPRDTYWTPGFKPCPFYRCVQMQEQQRFSNFQALDLISLFSGTIVVNLSLCCALLM